MPRDDCAQPEVARKDLETEIDILQRLQHPNIVEMLGAGFVNPLDVDADGGERGEFSDLDQVLMTPLLHCNACLHFCFAFGQNLKLSTSSEGGLIIFFTKQLVVGTYME